VFNEIQALLLSAALIGTIGFALISSKVSSALIALFYSSVVLGVIFTVFGDALLGVIQMATFAGAISVLTLVVILITGESYLGMGARRLGIAVGAILVTFVAAAFAYLTSAGSSASTASYPDISSQVFQFLWLNRPWDLLILIMAFASAMVTVINLLSREP